MQTKTEKRELSLKRKFLRDRNREYPRRLCLLPPEQWSHIQDNGVREAVYRSSEFLVQVFTEKAGIKRVSINRTALNRQGEWQDGIAWEEIQSIKNAIGFKGFDAVEIYPAEPDRVELHNIRHLWILPEPIGFAWRAKKPLPENQPIP